jgi:uncharacterized RDD family membrane protein YckC
VSSSRIRLNRQVRKTISALSDEELLAVIDRGARDYTPFAMSVARQELSKRGGRELVERRIAQSGARVAGTPRESATIKLPVGEKSGAAYNIYERDDYAGYWRRFLADSVDGLILAIPLLLISLMNETAGGLLALPAFALYHIGLKADRGTTLGYRLLGIKLVSMDGAEVTLRQVAIRQICSLLSALPFDLGFLWIAFDPNRQAWHDKIAATYVVRRNAAPVRKEHLTHGRSPVRARVWVAVVAALLVTGLIGGLVVFATRLQQGILNSEPYNRSKQYLGSNRWVREQVGHPLDFRLGQWSMRPDARTFEILVIGSKGRASSTVNLTRRGGIWEVVSASGYDDDGNEVDLMGGTLPGR